MEAGVEQRTCRRADEGDEHFAARRHDIRLEPTSAAERGHDRMVLCRAVVDADIVEGTVCRIARDRARKTHQQIVTAEAVDIEERQVQTDEALTHVDAEFAREPARVDARVGRALDEATAWRAVLEQTMAVGVLHRLASSVRVQIGVLAVSVEATEDAEVDHKEDELGGMFDGELVNCFVVSTRS